MSKDYANQKPVFPHTWHGTTLHISARLHGIPGYISLPTIAMDVIFIGAFYFSIIFQLLGSHLISGCSKERESSVLLQNIP